VRDEDFEPPEVPFQPKPTSVSIIAAAAEFSSESNFTTAPSADDIHQQNTAILGAGRGRSTAQPPPLPPRPSAPSHPNVMPHPNVTPRGAAPVPPRPRGRTQPPPPPPPPSARIPARRVYDEALHSAPTMIIDIRRVRGRGR